MAGVRSYLCRVMWYMRSQGLRTQMSPHSVRSSTLQSDTYGCLEAAMWPSNYCTSLAYEVFTVHSYIYQSSNGEKLFSRFDYWDNTVRLQGDDGCTHLYIVDSSTDGSDALCY